MPLPRRAIPSIAGLTAFEATARHLSFSQAAKELALTQGAVSKQVRQLELVLGVVLLERTKRHVVLTEVGKTYLAEVRQVLNRLEVITHSVLASGGSSAVLNLAVLPTFATRWLLPRLPRFIDARPGITVNFTTRLAPFDFAYERFDSAIHYGSPYWAGASAEHLFDEEVVPVASPRLSEEYDIRQPADLARVTLLQQTTRPSLWSAWFASVGVLFEHPFRGPIFDQFSMTAQAAAANLGVALVPRFLVEEEVATGKLLILFDRPLKGEHAYYLVTPTAKLHDPLVRAFAAWLKTEIRMARLSADARAPVRIAEATRP